MTLSRVPIFTQAKRHADVIPAYSTTKLYLALTLESLSANVEMLAPLHTAFLNVGSIQPNTAQLYAKKALLVQDLSAFLLTR